MFQNNSKAESRRLISIFNIHHPVYKGDIGMIKREIIDIKFMYLETGVVENKRDIEREREREMVKSVGGSILKKG